MLLFNGHQEKLAPWLGCNESDGRIAASVGGHPRAALGKGCPSLVAIVCAWILLSIMLLATGRPTWALSSEVRLSQCMHRSWGTADGLPAGAVMALAQDSEGYLWIGTQEGLVRFDGVRLAVYDSSNTPQMRNNLITALCPAKAGGIWIGILGGGLLKWEAGVLTAWTKVQGLPSMRIRSLLEDKSGNLWIGTEGGGLAQLRQGRFLTFTRRDGLAGNNIWSLAEGPKGVLWIGTDQYGLSRFKDGKFTTLTSKDGLPSDGIISLCVDPGGALWIGTAGGGLARLQGGDLQRFGTADGLPGLTISALMCDENGTLWVGTQEGGLALFRHGRFEIYTSRQGLPNNMVLSLTEDREGSLWVGTMTGVTQLLESDFSTYTSDQGLPGNIALCCYADHAGNLWVGTTEGAAEIETSGSVRAITRKQGLPGSMVFAIHEDRAGHLWFGVEGHGMVRYDKGTFYNLTMKDGLICNNVRSLCDASAGGLWVGTPSGLSLVQGGKITNFTLHNGNGREGVNSLAEAPDGSLWVGTDSGTLHHFKDGVWTTYNSKTGGSSLSVVSIDSITIDRDGTLWMGSSGGLLRFKGHKFTAFGPRSGLPLESFYQILEDAQGRLWMASNRGIVVASKASLNGFAEGRIKQIQCRVFDTSDGMRSAECNGGGAPTGCRLPDGRLCFPTMIGLAVVDPGRIPPDTLPPPTVIEGMQVDGESVPLRQGLSLQAGVRRIELQYTALSFLAPTKIAFRYRLGGYDKSWIDAGLHREAYYTNLQPGRYAFAVTACSRDGSWGTARPLLRFTVRPFFYQTKTFLFLCIFAALLLAALVNRLVVLQLRARNAVLRERNRIARDIHDTVAQGLTGVVLQLNTAESLLSPQMDVARGHLVRARALVESSLEETRRAIRALRPARVAHEQLAASFERLGASMTAGSDTEVLVDVKGRPRRLRDQAMVEDLWGIGREALTNALRHGKCAHVWITLEYSRRRLKLTVRDDGPGFIATQEDQASTHGLLGMRERAQARGWSLDLTSAPGHGTSVTVAVSLPPRLFLWNSKT